jgi:uncharacterized protein (TIGR02265 family)
MAATIIGEPRVKGATINARLRWLRERNPAALERALASLPPDDQTVLRGQVLHIGWYPLALKRRFDNAIAEVLAPDAKERAFREMGRASAEINLAGPHKAYVHEGDPQALLAQAPTIYRTGNELGRREYTKTGPTSATVRTYGTDPTPGECHTALGWFERAIEVCGGKSVKVVETRCQSRGSDCCELTCEWS